MLKPKKKVKKKVNSGNPLVNKAIKKAKDKKAAAKKKSNLGPVKGGASTVKKANRLNYLTKAADSKVKKATTAKKKAAKKKAATKKAAYSFSEFQYDLGKATIPNYSNSGMKSKKEIAKIKAAKKQRVTNKKKNK
jgi:hypothetical protein|tara:strand:+ start:122 stop:526 length:405 start_codon:yes stop_codon:yes gene_type:complete